MPRESLGRFAAVLGMALGEADRRPPIVDFANVRQRLEARRFGRVHALAAAVAALAALWFVGSSLAADRRADAASWPSCKTRIRDVQAQAEMYKRRDRPGGRRRSLAGDRRQSGSMSWSSSPAACGRSRSPPKTFPSPTMP